VLTRIEFNADMKGRARCSPARDPIETSPARAAYEKVGSAVTGGRRDDLAPIHVRPTRLRYDARTDQLVESLEKEGRERSSAVADEERPIEQSDNSLVRLLNNMIIEAHKDRRLRHPHRELSGQGEDPGPLPQGRHRCAPTSSCRRTTATR
jgi:hypothetical protein